MQTEEQAQKNAELLVQLLMPMTGEGEQIEVQFLTGRIRVARFCVNYIRLTEAGLLPPWEAIPQAHLLMFYWHTTQGTIARAKKNLVYEDELSLKYTPEMARIGLQRLSAMAGFSFDDVIKEWNWIERLERRFSLDRENLPQPYRFKVI